MLERLLGLVAPHECLQCGDEGHLLCGECQRALKPATGRCYRCHKLSAGNRTCLPCRRISRLYAVHAVTSYDGVAKQLVGKLKFGGGQSAARDMAAMMAPLVQDLPADTLIVHLPTASRRIRQRGFDQAALIARALARQTGLSYQPLLSRLGHQRQVGANRQQRLNQLAGAYRITSRSDLPGCTVILVDDVLTTGASLETAAALLRAAGAKRVIGLVFARA